MEINTRWTKIAEKQLLNRTITSVRYMTDKEQLDMGWYKKSLIIELDNGLLIYPSADSEGNDAGVVFTTDKDNNTLPAL
jgi:hypothetical protein